MSGAARPTRILLVGDQGVTFISDYRQVLQGMGEVRCVHPIRRRDGLRGMLRNLRALLAGVLWADVSVTYFMDLDAALAALFGRPLGKASLAVLAGYEVHSVDGNAAGAKAVFPKLAAYFSSGIIAVHEDLRRRAVEGYGADPRHIAVINTALDPAPFPCYGEDRKWIITIGLAGNEARIRVKGLDTFVELARSRPDLSFMIVGAEGKAADWLLSQAPPNLTVEGRKEREQVVALLNQSRVYCQLSRREGFPIAVCEAMLCGCVPVGSDIPGIVTIVGDAGTICPVGEVAQASSALDRALQMSGKAARARILENFSRERFCAGVARALDDALNGRPLSPPGTDGKV
jgi:glycosyltransferase involved in cell wall biosynthesis